MKFESHNIVANSKAGKAVKDNAFQSTLSVVPMFLRCVFKFTAVSVAVLISQAVFAQQDIFNSKPNVMWLSDQLSVPVFDSTSSYDSSFLGSGEVWSKNWGLSTKVLENEDQVFGLPQDSSIFSVDVKRRFAVKDNSQIEFGVGWQEFSVESLFDTSGARISLGGSLDFGSAFTVYGSTAWYPEIEDTFRSSEQSSAFELEAGLLYQPFPSLSLKAGYRQFSFESDDDLLDDLGSNSGFLLGTDLSW